MWPIPNIPEHWGSAHEVKGNVTVQRPIRDGDVPVAANLYTRCCQGLMRYSIVVNKVVGEYAVLHNASHVGGVDQIEEVFDPVIAQSHREKVGHA